MNPVAANPVPFVPAEDPGIEILRGVAACLVMLTHYLYMVAPHAGLWGFASTGVNLFFVLSGYVFAPYLHGRPVALAPHLVRRLFRLFPLYWVSLAIYIALRAVQELPTPHVAEHVFMLHTLQSVEVASTYNTAFWSLPPEVEFYLLLPLLAWLASRFSFRTVFIGALAIKFLLVTTAEPPGGPVTARAIATIHIPGLLCEFMLGAWAWHRVQSAPARRQRQQRAAAGVLVLLCTLTLFAWHVADWGSGPPIPPAWLAGTLGFWAALGYALLVSAKKGGVPSHPPTASQSVVALGVGLGHCSYGIYLLHNAAPVAVSALGWPLIGWPLALFCVTLTGCMAWVLHHTIERPMREWGRAMARRL